MEVTNLYNALSELSCGIKNAIALISGS